jgi:superfamily II DNA or RNA helicase
MKSFKEIDVAPSYRKGKDDIAQDFYLPCMDRATRYDRAVGFFSSTVYTIAWGSLKGFIQREGKINIVCSPALSAEDVNALSEGYEEENAEALRNEIEQLLSNPQTSKPTRVLASLVAIGALEFKVAFIEPDSPQHRRLFHDKVGIFTDAEDNKVVFKGSMNETWSGLSLGGNLESIDVYTSWYADARERRRAQDEVHYFQALWNNSFPSVSVKPFPEVARDRLIDAADPENWPVLVDNVCTDLEALEASQTAVSGFDGMQPRDHQAKAISAWISRERRGIFEHATGSGKTFTALCAVKDALAKGEVPIILVPSRLLFEQWEDEIDKLLGDDVAVLKCGNGHTRWKDNDLLGAFTRPSGPDSRLVLSTMSTAYKDHFRSSLHQGEHLFVVADEVHRIGSPSFQQILQVDSGPRLGLSATPRRAGDPDGTRAIFDYFEGVVPPRFGLQDAIDAGILTPYAYRAYSLTLSEEEQAEWDEKTSDIRRLYARNQRRRQTGENVDGSRIKMMLIDRARIAKGATAKIDLARRVIREHFEPGQRWLVYCDSQDQLYAVRDALEEEGVDPDVYHSDMEGDRQQTLERFKVNGGVVVSIKCLDEGVDIPAATHALVLASSRNPREFIQRRGRVLREAPDKSLAHIYDAIVVPRSMGDNEDPDTSLLEAELARAIEFGRGAIGPSSITDLERIAARYGISDKLEELSQAGYEDDSEKE